MKRGEVWWADLGPYRLGEQTGRRPVVIWQSDTLTKVLQTVLVIPLTTNKHRAQLAGTAMIASSPDGLPEDSVALAFQLRAIPKSALQSGFEACRKMKWPSSNWLRTRPWDGWSRGNRRMANYHSNREMLLQ